MLTGIDMELFHFFNQAGGDPFWDQAMLLITEIGGGEFIFWLALIALFFQRKCVKMSGMLLLAGLTVSYQLTHFLKEFLERPRPCNILAEVNFLYRPDSFSFPSAHTTIAFMSAFILAKCFKHGYVFYLLAFLVGVSRVYLGVHYPSDVASGALAGIIIGYVLVRFSRGIAPDKDSVS